jgi:predicted permease
MLYVAIAVFLSAAAGVAAERRTAWATRAARAALALMLYALVPFVSFVNFAHLRLTAGGGVGIVLAYAALLLDGALAWWIGRRWLGLSRPALGALICTVILVNTGYLGLPLVSAVYGSHELTVAVAYDQLVSGPMLLVVGFAVGAIFGARAGEGARGRVKAYLARNPPLLAVVAGLLTPASVVPTSLLSASHVVVLALLPLGFFVVGVNLSAERREDHAPLLERPDRRVVVAVALRLLTVLTIFAVVGLLIDLPRSYLVLAAMPTGINSLIVGHAYGLDQRLIATVIVWSTMVVLVVGLVAVAV